MTETNSTNSTPSALTQERILVVGAHTQLGDQLVRSLERDEAVSEFWVIDLFPLKRKNLKKARYISMDLIAPGADAALAESMKNIQATMLVHTALKNNPSANPLYSHELEVIGTLNLVSAAKAAGVKKFILCSSTFVYGASPKNPNHLTEKAALAKKSGSHFVRDKIEAEEQVLRLFDEAPAMQVNILRFCLIVGPRSHNFFTELFRRPLVPTLLGYDPLMQFIHERDALRALKKVMQKDISGIFNIVGRGVIPLSYALRKAGKWQVPLPSFLAYPAVQSLWNLHMISVPSRFLDFFRYLCVADGTKAAEILGFESKRTSKEAFIEFAKSDRLERMSLSS